MCDNATATSAVVNVRNDNFESRRQLRLSALSFVSYFATEIMKFNIDRRQFIEEVKNRPLLWNKNEQQFVNKAMSSLLWEEVGVICGTSGITTIFFATKMSVNIDVYI